MENIFLVFRTFLLEGYIQDKGELCEECDHHHDSQQAHHLLVLAHVRVVLKEVPDHVDTPDKNSVSHKLDQNYQEFGNEARSARHDHFFRSNTLIHLIRHQRNVDPVEHHLNECDQAGYMLGSPTDMEVSHLSFGVRYDLAQSYGDYKVRKYSKRHNYSL